MIILASALKTMFTPSEQIGFFLLSAVMGVGFGLLFDVFRAARVILPPLKKAVPTAVCDALFVIICGLCIYMFSLLNSGGEVRLYYAAGAAVGMALYLLTVGNAVMTVIRTVSGTLYKALRKVYEICTIPLVKFGNKIITNQKK